MHALSLDRDDVLDGAVFGVAGYLPGMEFPAESRPPQEIDGRLVVLHLGWRHPRGQDDASLPTVDDIMVVVAQTDATTAGSQWGGVRVGGARPIVGGPSI